jgi:hypothetical protein
MATNITTAVDSLVKLVNESKKISLTDAAKKLNIPEEIIHEWSSFLEEEGILEIEYKFTTPFLIAKITEGLDKESKDKFLEELKNCVEFVKEQSIKPTNKIKSEEDIKKMIKKGEKPDKKDLIYAQKIYLERTLKESLDLLNKGSISKTKLEDLLKKYELFRKKIKEV